MKSLLLRRAAALLCLLNLATKSVCLPIESVPYNGAVDYAGYPATDPAKAYPPRPPAPVLPFGFQPTGKPVLQVNTNLATTAPVIPPYPKGWPNNVSPISSSGSSTLVSPITPGGRPHPQRQQTLYETKNRPPTPFERPAPKRQQTLPAGHWHPSMGMGPRPATPIEPFIPPGFSDKKPNPDTPKVKAPQPKKKGTNGYEGDNERGRLRKTKGLAAPGYGSDSDSSSRPRAAKSQKAVIPGGVRKDKASPAPAGVNNRVKSTSSQVGNKSGVSKGGMKGKSKPRSSKDGAKPKPAAGSKGRK